MPVKQSIRVLASYYRKSARFAVFIILLASFVIPDVMAAGPGSLSISPDINVNAVSPFGCGFPLFPSSGSYQASGGVSGSGTYSGNVYFEASITIYGHDQSADKCRRWPSLNRTSAPVRLASRGRVRQRS